MSCLQEVHDGSRQFDVRPCFRLLSRRAIYATIIITSALASIHVLYRVLQTRLMAPTWCVQHASPVCSVSMRRSNLIKKALLIASSALAAAIIKDHSGILFGNWLNAIKPSLILDVLSLAKRVWQWLQPSVRDAGITQSPPGLDIIVLIPLALFLGYQLGRARRRPQPSRHQSISQPAAPRSEPLTPDSRLHAALELLRDLLPGHVVEELLEDAQQHSAAEHLTPSEPAQQTHIVHAQNAEHAGGSLSGPQPSPSPLQRQLEGILEDDSSPQPLSYAFTSASASSPPSPTPSSSSNLALFRPQPPDGGTGDSGGGGRGPTGPDSGQHPPAWGDGGCSDAAGSVLLPGPNAASLCAPFPYPQAPNSWGATGAGPARSCSGGLMASHGLGPSATGPVAVRPTLLPDGTGVLQQQPAVRRRLSLGRGPSYDSCSWPYKSYGTATTHKRCVSFSIAGAPYTSVPYPAASVPDPSGVARVGLLPPYAPTAASPSCTHNASGSFADAEVLDAWLHGASGGIGVMRGPGGGIGADGTDGINSCGRLWAAADASAGAGHADGSGCGGVCNCASSGPGTGDGTSCGSCAGPPAGAVAAAGVGGASETLQRLSGGSTPGTGAGSDGSIADGDPGDGAVSSGSNAGGGSDGRAGSGGGGLPGAASASAESPTPGAMAAATAATVCALDASTGAWGSVVYLQDSSEHPAEGVEAEASSGCSGNRSNGSSGGGVSDVLPLLSVRPAQLKPPMVPTAAPPLSPSSYGRASWPAALAPVVTAASASENEVTDGKRAAAEAAPAPRLDLDRLDSAPSADSSAEGLGHPAVSLECPASENPAAPRALAATAAAALLLLMVPASLAPSPSASASVASVEQLGAVPGALASSSVWASAANGDAGGSSPWRHVGGQQGGRAGRSVSSTGGACTALQGSVVHGAATEGGDGDGGGDGHGREGRQGWRTAGEQGVRLTGSGASGDGGGLPRGGQSAQIAQAMGALGRVYKRELQDEQLSAAASWEGPQPLASRGEEAAGSLAWGCDDGRGRDHGGCARDCGANSDDGNNSSVVGSGSRGSIYGSGGSGGGVSRDSTATTTLSAAASLLPISVAVATAATEAQISEHSPWKLSDVDLLPVLPPSPPLASQSSPVPRDMAAGMSVWDAWHASSGDLAAAAAAEDELGRATSTAAPGRSPTALTSSVSRRTSGAGSCGGVASGVHSAVHNTMLTFSSMLSLLPPPPATATAASVAAAAVADELQSAGSGTVRSCLSCCSSDDEGGSAAGGVGAVGGEGVVGAGGAGPRWGRIPAALAASAVPQPSRATATSACHHSGLDVPAHSVPDRRSKDANTDDEGDNDYGDGDGGDDGGGGMEQLLDLAFVGLTGSTLTAALAGAPLPAAAPVAADITTPNAGGPCLRGRSGFRSGLRRVKTCIAELFALGGGGGGGARSDGVGCGGGTGGGGGAAGELSGAAVDGARGVVLAKPSTGKPGVSGATSALLRTASSVAGSVVGSILYGTSGAAYNVGGGCGGFDAPASPQRPAPRSDHPPSPTLVFTDDRPSHPAGHTHWQHYLQYGRLSSRHTSYPVSYAASPGDLHCCHRDHHQNNERQQRQRQPQEQQQQGQPSAAEGGFWSRASAPAFCDSPQTTPPAPLPDCHSGAGGVAGAGPGPSAPVGNGPATLGPVPVATPRVSDSSTSPFLAPFTTPNPAPSASLTTRSSCPHLPFLPYLSHHEEASPAGHGHVCSDMPSSSPPPSSPGSHHLQAPYPCQDAPPYPSSHQQQQTTPHPYRYSLEAQQHAAQHQQHGTHHQPRPQIQPQLHNMQQVVQQQQQQAQLMPQQLPVPRPATRRSLSRLNLGLSLTGPSANLGGNILATNCHGPNPNSNPNPTCCSNTSLNAVDRVSEPPDLPMELQPRAIFLRRLMSDASGAQSPTASASPYSSGPMPYNYTNAAPTASMAAAAIAAPSGGGGWRRADGEQDGAFEAVTATGATATAAAATGVVRHRRLHRASTGLLGAGTWCGGSDTSALRGSASSALPLGRTLGFSGSSGGGGGGGSGSGAAAGRYYSGCGLGRDLPYAEWHPCVSVLFADIVGFTQISNKVSAVAVMEMLNALYCRLDGLCATWQQQHQQHHQHAHSSLYVSSAIHGSSPSLPAAAASPSSSRSRPCGSSYGPLTSTSASSAPPPVYKVQIIGDAYMVATGLLEDDPAHAATACLFALAALHEAAQVVDPCDGRPLQLRVGIHSGPVVSGVVGRMRRQYSVFGDTVNVASRMESTGAPGAIHVSEETQRLAAPYTPYSVVWRRREGVEVKGKGVMNTYWLQEAPYHHHQQPLSSPPVPPAPAAPHQRPQQVLQPRSAPLPPLLAPQGSNTD